ncbi:uncharacterized protein LOC120282757 [Dioscorea cayenensis subsp. rotundata]|uniref:Uncharacterized protein LOC120282757 n=1 Tax=Dioscorea cayennensis subsp. rotundata TaxID=55577 RepID=A0AB40CZK5_DIOCR|nr:uncharacterized protein LOC120282757 [Dioscorea cayenensis subsp. rotundata]
MSKLIKERLPGSLPGNTKVNPKESLKAITLRSAKQLPSLTETEPEVEIIEPLDLGKEKTELPKYQPKLPYPVKMKKDQQEEKYKKFLDVFKALHINVPFVEALALMPRYAKFLKELLTNKRNLEEVSSVTLSEECSALITNKLRKKEKNPGGFIVPCIIGGLVDEKAQVDLGESINLIPYQIFQKLRLGEPKATTMTLQLVDRSIRKPRGIIEDVL